MIKTVKNFLSKDELNLIYLNNGQISTQSVANGGTTLSGEYWSSSEHNSGGGNPFWSAWRQTFWNSGFQGTSGKGDVKAVRAVRYFSNVNTDTTNCVWVSNAGWNYITVITANGLTATDSVYVSLNTPVSGSSSVSACNTYTWEGQTITNSGNLTHTYQSALGCDSVHTLSVTINNSTSNTTTVTDCDSYTWSVNGTAYTQSGTYTDVSTNSFGCTHTETLVLTINNSTSNTTTITDCDSYTWSVNNQTYTTSGTYTDLSTNASGCTHTETLVLTINNSTSNSTTVTECDSYTWSINNQTYTTSGTYTDVSLNASGCTHTETLVLTINNSTSNSTTITECDSYTWPVNGTAYTTSGTYTDISTNASGCTHTETLVLTINNSTSNTTTITDCDSYTWSVNNQTYTTSGTYTDLSTNASGCTHTETLVLTINNSTSNTTSITECDSYTWSVNGTAYTSSGTYTDVSVNASGCTHTETLVLTINNSISLTNTVSICFGDSITVGSNTYSQTGIYTDAFTAVNGCDSIITTNLNVSQQITAIISQLGMDIKANPTGGNMPYVYEWNTGEITQQITPIVNGDYWVIVMDANECISDTTYFTVDWIHTSVEDFNIDRLNIYPNPSRDVFNIEFSSLVSQDLQIRIISSVGDVVFIEDLQNYNGEYKKQISLEKYSKAIYFLEIQTDDGIVNKKLILQ